jgi:hypothetical protein
MINDNELGRIWREAVMASFKVLSRNLPGGTEEDHGNFSQDNKKLETGRLSARHKCFH